METILTLLIANKIYLLGGLVLVGVATLVSKYKKARLLAFGLVLYFEEVLSTEAGEKKKELVITNIYSLLPRYISWIPKTFVEGWIDKAFVFAKDYLDDGIINGSQDVAFAEKADNELTKRLTQDGNEIQFKIDGKF